MKTTAVLQNEGQTESPLDSLPTLYSPDLRGKPVYHDIVDMRIKFTVCAQAFNNL